MGRRSKIQAATNDPSMSNRLGHDPSKPLPPLAPPVPPTSPGGDVASQAVGAGRGASIAAKVGSWAAGAIGSTGAAGALGTAGSIGLKAFLPATAAVAGGWAAKAGYDAYQRGEDARGIASAAGWAAADSITIGIASAAWKQGEQAYAAWAPKAAPAQGGKAFAKANANFERARSEPKPEVASERKPGWGPEARIASAKARGIDLPYQGDPSQAPGFQPTKKELAF